MGHEEVKITRRGEREKAELFDRELDSPEVIRRYEAAARGMQKNEVVAAFYLAEVEKRRLWFELGYSSVIHYAKEAGDISEGKAYSLLRIGKGLAGYPLLRRAYSAGRISWTKAREIFRLKGGFDEEEMLCRAETLDNRELESFVSARNRALQATRKRRATSIGAAEVLETPGILPGDLFLTPSASGASPARSDLCAEDDTGETAPAGIDGQDRENGAAPEYEPLFEGESATAGSGGTESAAAGSGPGAGAGSFPIDPVPGSVSVMFRLTPEEHAILQAAHRTWKRKNRAEWKRERMLATLLRHYLAETAESACREKASTPPTATRSLNQASDSSADDFPGERGAQSTGNGFALPEKRTGNPLAPDGAEDGASGEVDSGREVSPVLFDSPYSVVIYHCSECGKNAMAGKRGDMLEVDEPIVEQALCDGSLHEADENGMPGRKKRSVSPALRKKIFARDRGVCRTPGCGSSSFLEIHHVRPLSRGGVFVTLDAPPPPGEPGPESIVLSPRLP